MASCLTFTALIHITLCWLSWQFWLNYGTTPQQNINWLCTFYQPQTFALDVLVTASEMKSLLRAEMRNFSVLSSDETMIENLWNLTSWNFFRMGTRSCLLSHVLIYEFGQFGLEEERRINQNRKAALTPRQAVNSKFHNKRSEDGGKSEREEARE